MTSGLLLRSLACLIGIVLIAGISKFWTSASPFGSRHIAAHPPTKNLFAVIVSGDGILTPLSDALCDGLAAHGIAVSQTRALAYFWSRRSPEAMSTDLEHTLRHRLRTYPDDRFILIGYSFGAGTLPFAINRLSGDLISRIDRVVLLAPPEDADFKFYFRSWINRASKDAYRTAPEIAMLAGVASVLYLRGRSDYPGPWSELEGVDGIECVELYGGHDFNKSYDQLVKLIIKRDHFSR